MYYILAFISVIFYSLMGPIGKKASENLLPFTMMCLSSFGVFVLASIGIFLFEKDQVAKVLISYKEYYNSLVAYIIVNFIGYFTFIIAIRHMPVVQYEIIYMCCPIIAGIGAYFLLGEQWNDRYFLSILFVSLGIYIALMVSE